jgi:hypothetical protein
MNFIIFHYIKIPFEDRCSKTSCIAELTLRAGISPRDIIIEGDEKYNGISLDINVRNDGENSLNTSLVIQMNPMLELADLFDEKRCLAQVDHYICNINDNLQTRRFENLKLAFIVSKIDSNLVKMNLTVKSESEIKEGSPVVEDFELIVIREAKLSIVG